MSQKSAPVICDGCEADITTTGNSVDYRLQLDAYSPPSWGGCVTDMMIYPAIEETHHFCNDLDCVRAWLAGPEAVAKRKADIEARWERINKRNAPPSDGDSRP